MTDQHNGGRRGGWLVVGLATLLLAACGSGGTGGGGGNGGGNRPGLTVVPLQASLEPRQSINIDATATNVGNPVFTYTVIAPTELADADAEELARRFGSVAADGIFTASSEAEAGLRGAVRVVETTSRLSADVPIRIVPAIQRVEIIPDLVSLLAGQTQAFRVEAYDFLGEVVPSVLVDWRVATTPGGQGLPSIGFGRIDRTGVFTALQGGTGVVQAFVGEASAEAEVTVVGTVTGLSLRPQGTEVLVETGTTRRFRAVVGDAAGNQSEVAATWSLTPATLGTITDDGLFTAAASGAAGTVTARYEGETATVTVRVVDLLTPPSQLPGNVFGRVRDAQQAPQSGLVVRAVRQSDDTLEATTRTDADGNYRLFLPVGTYRIEAVSAQATVLASRRDVALPAQDVRREVNLTLAP